MDRELLDELVAIDQARKDLKQELDTLNEERARLEGLILTHFESEGVTQIKRDDATIYLHTRKWWKPINGNRQAVVKVLESLELDDMVTFNTTTLSSYCNELQRDNHEIPPELRAVIEEDEQFKVKVGGL